MAQKTVLVDCGERVYTFNGLHYGPGVVDVADADAAEAIRTKHEILESGEYPDPYADGPEQIRRTARQGLIDMQANRDDTTANALAERDALKSQLADVESRLQAFIDAHSKPASTGEVGANEGTSATTEPPVTADADNKKSK